MNKYKIPPFKPPHYFYAGCAVATLLHFTFPVKQLIPFPFTLIGIPIIIWSVWLAVAAKKLFIKKYKTAISPGKVSTTLITEGAFRWSRNPMYLGMVVGHAGLAILLGSLSPWIMPVLMFLILHFSYILLEETMLKETFGELFDKYCLCVRRWV